MVGKSIIADRVCICDPMGPGWMFDRVINADRASSSNPHGRGPGWMFDRSSPTACKNQASIANSVKEPGFHRRPGLHLRSHGTWLEFDRVIIAEPGQQQQSPREGTWLEFPRWSANRSSPTGFASAIPWDLVGVRSIIAEPGQQQSPREGTWLDVRSIIADRASSRNPHGRGPGWSSIDHRRPGHVYTHRSNV